MTLTYKLDLGLVRMNHRAEYLHVGLIFLGLRRIVNDCCFFALYTNILTYLLRLTQSFYRLNINW